MIDLEFFKAIGFNISTHDEIGAFIDMAIEKGAKPSSPRGFYSYWPLGNGAEVWIALDKTRDVQTFDLHFVGSSRVPVRLDSLYDIGEELTGGFKVWTNPHTTEEDGVKFPMMLAVPDWDFVYTGINQRMKAATGPFIFDLQVCAIAKEVKCFASEDEYYDDQKSQNLQHSIAATSFFPSGLFVEPDALPGPWAVFGGTIKDGRVLVNPVTQAKSWYFSVETLNMTVDVIADATAITGRPQKGGLMSGSFCLSGRPWFDIQNLHNWLRQGGVH